MNVVDDKTGPEVVLAYINQGYESKALVLAYLILHEGNHVVGYLELWLWNIDIKLYVTQHVIYNQTL